VTVTLVWALTGKRSGSETTRAPLGTANEGDPEKVRCWRVPGRMAGEPAVPLAGRAMVAAVMGRSEPPKALLNWNRIVDASWVR
jgi:hypothetical protein